ncbi:MAG: prepilin-type N-terminal cleavage/methylation domain-containing protein [Bacilli bacterium]|nr:prepilin-type N-terminal cleavage/methylation domain-containing protein [Bacilli bacterium]
MKNKGFTLIELLAVIVILAIIALIATPIILGIIDDARKEAKERTVELVASGVQYAYTNYLFNNQTDLDPDFCEYMTNDYFKMDKGSLKATENKTCENNVATVVVGTDEYTVTFAPATGKATIALSTDATVTTDITLKKGTTN